MARALCLRAKRKLGGLLRFQGCQNDEELNVITLHCITECGAHVLLLCGCAAINVCPDLNTLLEVVQQACLRKGRLRG